MGLIADGMWPERLTAALEGVVARIPANVLERVAARVPEFTAGGFRVAGAKPETLGRRALQLLRAGGTVPEPLRSLVAEYSLQGRLLGLLSEDTLLRRRDELEACLGAEDVLLGLFLDGREGVRRCAAERLAGLTGDAGALNAARAREAVQSLFGGFFEALVPVLEQAAESEGLARDELPSAPAQRLERLEGALREAQSKAARVAGLEAKVRKLEASLQGLRVEHAALRERAETCRREAAAARAEADGLRVDLERERSARQGQVAAEVAERLADEVFEWLRDVRALEAAEAQATSGDLAERAREVLRRQREVDRRAGSLSGLRQRLAELGELRSELQRAQADALNPLSELAALDTELGKEVARLARVPGVVAKAGDSPLATALLARAATVAEREAEAFDALVARLSDWSVLTSQEVAALRAARKRRTAVRLATALVPARPADAPVASTAALARSWRRVAGTPSGGVLLVDGHNVLLGLDRYAAALAPDGRPGEAARERLLRDVSEIVASVPELEARVFFDGPAAGETAFAPRVLSVFSGGRGSGRADGRIVDYLQFRRQSKVAGKAVLVTDDRGLREESRAVDGQVVLLTLGRFGELVSALR